MYFRQASILLVLLTVTLGACQSPPAAKKESATKSTATQSAASAAMETALDGKTTGVFDARLKQALSQVAANAADSCISGAYSGGMESYMACYTKKMMLAFEPTGQALEHCPDLNEKGVACAIAGALLGNLREKSGTPIAAASWKKIEGVLAGEMIVAVFDESNACAKEGRAGDDARTCLGERLMTRLGGNEADGRACVSIKDDAKFGQCLGEGATTKMIEDLAAAEAM